MVNYISDYTDQNGKSYHRVNVVLGEQSEQSALNFLLDSIRREGYIPTCVIQVAGVRTLDELEQFADHRVTGIPFRIVYLNKQMLKKDTEYTS